MADLARGAGPVVHHGLLTERLGETLRDEPGHAVGRAPRRIGYDDPDRPVRIARGRRARARLGGIGPGDGLPQHRAKAERANLIAFSSLDVRVGSPRLAEYELPEAAK